MDWNGAWPSVIRGQLEQRLQASFVKVSWHSPLEDASSTVTLVLSLSLPSCSWSPPVPQRDQRISWLSYTKCPEAQVGLKRNSKKQSTETAVQTAATIGCLWWLCYPGNLMLSQELWSLASVKTSHNHEILPWWAGIQCLQPCLFAPSSPSHFPDSAWNTLFITSWKMHFLHSKWSKQCIYNNQCTKVGSRAKEQTGKRRVRIHPGFSQ